MKQWKKKDWKTIEVQWNYRVILSSLTDCDWSPKNGSKKRWDKKKLYKEIITKNFKDLIEILNLYRHEIQQIQRSACIEKTLPGTW